MKTYHLTFEVIWIIILFSSNLKLADNTILLSSPTHSRMMVGLAVHCSQVDYRYYHCIPRLLQYTLWLSADTSGQEDLCLQSRKEHLTLPVPHMTVPMMLLLGWCTRAQKALLKDC